MDDQKERLEQEEAAVKEQTASEPAEQTAQEPAAAPKRTTRRRRKPAAEKTEPAEQTQLTMDQTAPAEDAGKTAEETAEQSAPKRTTCRCKTGTGSTASRTKKKQAEEAPAEAAALAEQPAEEAPAEAAAPAEQPAEKVPAEAAAPAEQPTGEVPAEAAPTEQPAEEPPAEAAAPAEQPAVKAPAEAAASAEQPAEEVPAEAAAPAEKAEEPAQKKPRKKRGKHRYAAPVGGAYILLALIGVIAVIYGAVQLYGKLTDNSKLLRQIERQIQPVMMFDPVPFDNIQDVDNKVLVKTSIWSCMYSDKRGSYTYDDNGMILIPVSDVEVAAVKLYGPEVKLTHTSLDEDGISYTYDAENNVYRVPMMAQGGYYTPMVVDMQKNGDVYEVTVGYVAPGASWTTTEDGDSYTPTPDKYMIYRMKKEDGEYYIVGIKDPGEAPVDTTTPPDVVPGLSSSEAA